MFSSAAVLTKEAKLKAAEQIKEEKRKWKEEKQKIEREEAEKITKRNKELNDLEKSYLEELSKRKPKVAAKKDERFFFVKKKKAKEIEFPERSPNKIILPNLDKKETMDKNMNEERSPVKVPFDTNTPITIDSLKTIYEKTGQNRHYSKSPEDQLNNYLSIQNKEHSVPLIHSQNKDRSRDILSKSRDKESFNRARKLLLSKGTSSDRDNSKKDLQQRSEKLSDFNSNQSFVSQSFVSQKYSERSFQDKSTSQLFKHISPSEIASNNINQSSERLDFNPRKKLKITKKTLPMVLRAENGGFIHIVGDRSNSEKNSPLKERANPYVHMFRDFEVLNTSSKSVTPSKMKLMKDYEKTVKRNKTPKPDLKSEIITENRKLEKYLEKITKKIKFFKIFN